MLTLFGRASRYCDGVDRRSFLRAGALAIGGLSLADLLRLQATAETNRSLATDPHEKSQARSGKAVIFVELGGGPSHFETYDPKPNAPVEFRGPLDAVGTNVPGVFLSQYMSEQAKLLDKLAIVRSVRHTSNAHDPSSHLTQTGYLKRGQKAGLNEMPCFGSVAARVVGANAPGLPAYVALPRLMRNGGAAYLGTAYNPFETITDPGKKNFSVRNLALSTGLSVDRLEDRRTLLTALDSQRQLMDLERSSEAIDDFTRQALEMVTGPRAQAAFDIKREKDSVREKYGLTEIGQSLLLARRLVEAGVTCVTVRFPGWDNHQRIAKAISDRGPMYDAAMAALIRDLFKRGLDRDVLLVAMGEFGRTPRVNRNAGRDHWGSAMSVLLAGGGLKTGIVGATNSKGELPVEAPYGPENILATIYRHLGIDASQTFVDLSGRPRYVLEERRPIEELI
ncbi:MAG TPA: DUF1501 domain-containing protein [Pirellulales bacterium]|nr:DUF1501 domain-containing protein [Pirellulales bacterium]